MKSTNVKKITGIITVLIAMLAFFAISALASSPNYATSKEHWTGLYSDGYVQIQPSYNDNGYHAARGYFVYRNGRDGEQWASTAYGQGPEDSAIYKASMRYWDIIAIGAPKVTFNYNFDWVPHGSPLWPN